MPDTIEQVAVSNETDVSSAAAASTTTTAAPVTETPAAAPVTTPAATPAAPSTPADKTELLRAAVGRAMDKQPGFEVTPKSEAAKPATEAKPGETAATEQAKPGEAEAKPGEVKPGEQKAEAAKTGDQKTEEQKTEEAEQDPLDALGTLSTQSVQKALTDVPELGAALEKAGIDKETLFETTRNAALYEQIRDIAPTKEAAEALSQSAENFYRLDEALPNLKTVQDFDKLLMDTILPMSILVGEDGKPVLSADGKTYETDGSVRNFLSLAVQYDTVGAITAVDHLIRQAKAMGGEEGEQMLAEAERVREAFLIAQNFRDSNGQLPSAKKDGPTELPADVKQRMDQLERDAAQGKTARADAERIASETFQENIMNSLDTTGSKLVEGILSRTALSDTEKGLIAEKAIVKALDAMAKNGVYQRQMRGFLSQGRTDEVKRSAQTLANQTFKNTVTPILRDLITPTGEAQVKRQQERLDKKDTQSANDRHNQAPGTTATAHAPAISTPAEVRAKAIENLKAKGLETSLENIMSESLLIRSAGAAAR